MKTLSISLIEKKPHRDGGTYDYLKFLEVLFIKNEARTMLLQDVIQQREVPILLQIQNNQITTLLDCTGVTPYEIWYFDERLEFTGKAYSLNEGGATFQIQTQAKWVLFIHLASKAFDDLKHFECSVLDIADKYKFVKKAFPSGYGIFPYLIVKHEKSVCFSQIPIHINPTAENLPGWILEMDSYIEKNEVLMETKLVEAAKNYCISLWDRQNRIFKIALVLSPNKAYYFNGESEATCNTSIPSGGVLLDTLGHIIAKNTNHYIV